MLLLDVQLALIGFLLGIQKADYDLILCFKGWLNGRYFLLSCLLRSKVPSALDLNLLLLLLYHLLERRRDHIQINKGCFPDRQLQTAQAQLLQCHVGLADSSIVRVNEILLWLVVLDLLLLLRKGIFLFR